VRAYPSTHINSRFHVKQELTVTIGDISAATFGERARHFYEQSVGPKGHESPVGYRQSAMEAARKQAGQEMLDEIHTMLRRLLELQGEKVGT
jgi:hypothetical protein